MAPVRQKRPTAWPGRPWGRGQINAAFLEYAGHLAADVARLADAGEVALDIGQEHRHADLRKRFGQFLQGNGLAGTCCTDGQPMAVGQARQDGAGNIAVPGNQNGVGHGESLKLVDERCVPVLGAQRVPFARGKAASTQFVNAQVKSPLLHQIFSKGKSMAGHSKWANIQHRKGRQDEKRGKVWTRIIREIIVAARHGGGDVTANPRLRLAIDKAKAASMPADTIKRNIDKATGTLEGVD